MNIQSRGVEVGIEKLDRRRQARILRKLENVDRIKALSSAGYQAEKVAKPPKEPKRKRKRRGPRSRNKKVLEVSVYEILIPEAEAVNDTALDRQLRKKDAEVMAVQAAQTSEGTPKPKNKEKRAANDKPPVRVETSAEPTQSRQKPRARRDTGAFKQAFTSAHGSFCRA